MSVVDVNDSPGARALRSANLASMALNGHPSRLDPDLPQPPMLGHEEEAPVANDNKKPLFDFTIGWAQVLALLAIAGGAFAYSLRHEQRLVTVEERQVMSASQSDERTRELKDSVREIKQDVKDVQRTVNDLAARMAPKRDRN